jgi:hypothetical protein
MLLVQKIRLWKVTQEYVVNGAYAPNPFLQCCSLRQLEKIEDFAWLPAHELTEVFKGSDNGMVEILDGKRYCT